MAEILPALDGREERRGEALLARPTDGPNDPYGDGYTVAPLAAYSTNFCYFWVTTGPDAVPLTDSNANGIPDYIDVLATTAEQSSRSSRATRLAGAASRRDARCSPDGGED